MSNFINVMRKFPGSFWAANAMELFERWAWYGMYIVLPLYLVGSTDEGALGFSQAEKGMIMGTGTMICYLLPVITGAIADKVGYKKILMLSYACLSVGYFIFAYNKTFISVFIVYIFIAIGAALFKPVVSATIAKSTTKETASIGFGFFYMIVNVGGFLGPIVASKIRATSWSWVFICSAIAISINFLILFFFKEPEREVKKEPLGELILNILKNILSALKDKKLLIFLLIISLYWTMYYQLFISLPNYIDQWINTSILYDSIASLSPKLAEYIGTADKIIAPEMIINIVAGLIIVFQIAISTLVMKWSPLSSIISGTFIISIGMGLSFITNNPFFLLIGVIIFSFGEMASSPKFNEYIGRIAPKNKEALYMGTFFLSVSLGSWLSGIFSGYVFGPIADKLTLLKKEVLERGLSIPEISKEFTQNDFFKKAGELMGMDDKSLTQFLWDKYDPSSIWLYISIIGVAATILFLIFDRFLLRKKSI